MTPIRRHSHPHPHPRPGPGTRQFVKTKDRVARPNPMLVPTAAMPMGNRMERISTKQKRKPRGKEISRVFANPGPWRPSFRYNYNTETSSGSAYKNPKNPKNRKFPSGSNGKREKRHVTAYESTDVDWLQQY